MNSQQDLPLDHVSTLSNSFEFLGKTTTDLQTIKVPKLNLSITNLKHMKQMFGSHGQ